MIPYYFFVPHYEDFPHFDYDQAAANCSDTDILVEVGSFLGYSTCYMAERLNFYQKKPKFYAIDSWDQLLGPAQAANRYGNMPWGEPIATWHKRGGKLYDSFLFYLNNCPNKDRVYDYAQFPADSCMGEFEDNTVSFVYLGYSWDEPEINQQIEGWMPKLKTGGRLVVCPTVDFPRVRVRIKS